jgi:hypothetical protein
VAVGEQRMQHHHVSARTAAYGSKRAATGGHLLKLHNIHAPKVLANDIRAFVFQHRPNIGSRPTPGN